MKLFKMATIISLLLLVGAFLYQQTWVKAQTGNDLRLLMDAVEQEEGLINEWSAVTRTLVDGITQELFEQKSEQLQANHSDFSWTMNTTTTEQQLVGTRLGKFGQEKIVWQTTDTNGQRISYLYYELAPQTGTTQDLEEAQAHYEKQKQNWFTPDQPTFYTVKGTFDDNRTIEKQINGLLSQLDATKREMTTESHFTSVSAESPRLSQKVRLAHKHMNVQIGVRHDEMGGKTNIIIGTPIITTEY